MRKAALIAVMLLAGCNVPSGATAETDVAVESRAQREALARFDAEIARFHASLSAGDYDAIYDRAAPSLQRYASREEFTRALADAHASMGSFVGGRRVTERVQHFASTTAHIDMETHWTNGEALESFSLREKDGVIGLEFWGIDSAIMRPDGSAPSMPGRVPGLEDVD